VSSRYELFQSYLQVCNQALDLNRERFPFKQVLGAAQKAGKERRIQVCIVEGNPAAEFVIKIEGNKLKGEQKDTCSGCGCAGQWRVSQRYMEDVVENPDLYINNPAKLDWDWLYGQND
jgi:hypothetical protein